MLQSLLRAAWDTDKVEVINIGIPAYSTHALILLELDVLAWRPDLVILSHNFNDLQASYFPDFTYDYSNKYSNEFYGVANYKSRFTLTNLLFQHSQFYLWIMTRHWEGSGSISRILFPTIARGWRNWPQITPII